MQALWSTSLWSSSSPVEFWVSCHWSGLGLETKLIFLASSSKMNSCKRILPCLTGFLSLSTIVLSEGQNAGNKLVSLFKVAQNDKSQVEIQMYWNKCYLYMHNILAYISHARPFFLQKAYKEKFPLCKELYMIWLYVTLTMEIKLTTHIRLCSTGDILPLYYFCIILFAKYLHILKLISVTCNKIALRLKDRLQWISWFLSDSPVSLSAIALLIPVKLNLWFCL